MLSFSPRSAIVVSFVRFRRAQQGHCAMRVRVLHAKLYAYALPGSTARQLVFSSSTLLDSSTARQNSTDLNRPRHPGAPAASRGACSQPRLASTGSTATRQLLNSYSTGSTGKALSLTGPRQRGPRQRAPRQSGSMEPRQLDSSRARAQARGGAGAPPLGCSCVGWGGPSGRPPVALAAP